IKGGAAWYVLTRGQAMYTRSVQSARAHRQVVIRSGLDKGAADAAYYIELAFGTHEGYAPMRNEAQVLLERHRRGDETATGVLQGLATQAMTRTEQFVAEFAELTAAAAMVDLLFERYVGLVPRFHTINRFGP